MNLGGPGEASSIWSQAPRQFVWLNSTIRLATSDVRTDLKLREDIYDELFHNKQKNANKLQRQVVER